MHAVAVEDGAVVAQAGDPGFLASLRSAAKPLQALPLARAYPGLEVEQLAIACASHLGEPVHVAAVRSLLATAGADESALECGLEDRRPPEPIFHNCSGKHAGMLAVCRAHGWALEGYRLPEHPLQQHLVAEVAAAADVRASELSTGTDGCGVVAVAMPLERAALAYSRLERLDAGDRVVAAMRGHPHLIRGAGATDTLLMQRLPGWVAKGGAEGLLCAAAPGGLGVALKVEDGNSRAQRPATAAFLARLDVSLPDFARVAVRDGHGDEVGTLEVE